MKHSPFEDPFSGEPQMVLQAISVEQVAQRLVIASTVQKRELKEIGTELGRQIDR